MIKLHMCHQVKEEAAPRGDDAAISVPLLQSPPTTQGPGDDAADEDFVMPPHPAMISAGNLAKTGLNAETNAGIALGEDVRKCQVCEDAFGSTYFLTAHMSRHLFTFSCMLLRLLRKQNKQ